jgi:hypothetical protein
MALDALMRAACQRAVVLSADIECQFTEQSGRAPVLALLALAQKRAASAIVGLAVVDPEDPKGIRALQNDIVCFDRIVEWLKEIVRDGFDAGALLDQDDRQDLADAIGLTPDEAEDALSHGLQPHEDD